MNNLNDQVLNYLKGLRNSLISDLQHVEATIKLIESNSIPIANLNRNTTIDKPNLFDEESSGTSNVELLGDITRSNNTEVKSSTPTNASSSISDKIINVIESENRFLHRSEIAAKLSINPDSLSTTLSRMRKEGILRRVKYNNHDGQIFYGMQRFLKRNTNGKEDFKDSSFEPKGERTVGMSRINKEFN